MRKSNFWRWLTLAVISISGGISFDLAYLRYIYQIPMAKFMGFSNTEIGVIMSTFGITAIILYAPSGIVADKFSHRKMMAAGMLATGLLGLLMLTFPPLWAMLLIQVAFAITTILMLWSVSIKAASLLGSAEEQGKIIGWMEGLRGVGVMALAVFTMWVFSLFQPDDPSSLRAVILIYSVIYLLLGIACWLLLDDGNSSAKPTSQEEGFKLRDVLSVLRIPTTWYCSMIIAGVYTIYASLSYSTNYLSEIFGMTLVAASYMGVVINKIFRVVCGPIGGLFTTYSRMTSPTRTVQLLALVALLTLGVLLLLTAHPAHIALPIAMILLLAFTCYAARGLYFACISEARTPTRIMGTTVGICSVIGFLPDVFVYPLVGYWQDHLSAASAYRNLWIMGIVAMFVVLLFTSLLFREMKKKAQASAVKQSTEYV